MFEPRPVAILLNGVIALKPDTFLRIYSCFIRKFQNSVHVMIDIYFYKNFIFIVYAHGIFYQNFSHARSLIGYNANYEIQPEKRYPYLFLTCYADLHLL